MDYFKPPYSIFNDVLKHSFELCGKSKRKKLITADPVSQNEYLNVVFNGIKEARYRREAHKMTENYGDNRRSYTYHILSPVEKDFYVKHI